MKKKIILKRIFHRDEWRYALFFDYDKNLDALVKSITGIKWSQSNRCWYAHDDEETLKKILAVFRESADIDISAIATGEKGKLSALTTVLQSKKKTEPTTTIPAPDEKALDEKAYLTVNKEKKISMYSPVLFTISETDGRLVIKFTGRSDPEWIGELKTYGRPWFDKVTREWFLRWSQLAVDSLSDYFSSRGVEVIVKKKEIPVVIAEIRNERGNEVRERSIGKAAAEGIDIVRKYLEEKRYSKRTIGSYLAGLELFFKYFNTSDPCQITDNDISEFIEDHILKLGYSASYQNIIISAIKMFYNLNDNRRVNTDSLKRPRRSRALPKVFSKEEIMEIFSATKNNKHKLILWLIYSCGLRRSEVINIKLTDLDKERGILNIREAKGNTNRMVPIPQKIWEKIGTYIKSYKPDIYLFEGQTGGKYSAESVYAVFKHSLKLAGIKKDVGVHSLRHSYATHLHEGGLDIRYIQELLGHKSSRTTEIYTHVSWRNLFAIRSPIEDMDLD
ncbi:MAG: tyrosine-type recombinase/integrase [Bacteroidota bacterium]